VEATFREYPVRRIGSSVTYHLTLQEAYNAAATSGDIIKPLAEVFTETLICNRS
jgi:hypothetical protein